MTFRTVAVLQDADRRFIFCEGCGMCWGDGLVEDVKLVIEIGEESAGAQLLCADCRNEMEPPE